MHRFAEMNMFVISLVSKEIYHWKYLFTFSRRLKQMEASIEAKVMGEALCSESHPWPFSGYTWTVMMGFQRGGNFQDLASPEEPTVEEKDAVSGGAVNWYPKLQPSQKGTHGKNHPPGRC